MQEHCPDPWTAVTHALKSAALYPEQRDEAIARALQELLSRAPAVATALIWPCPQRRGPWKVYYAGIRRNAMHRWLSARLDPSPEVVAGVLERDLRASLSDMPPALLVKLASSESNRRAFWILWPTLGASGSLPLPLNEGLLRVRQSLEALLEVEEKEEHYFSPSSPVHDRALIEALAHGDAQALAAVLSLARVVTRADFTFWGRAYNDVVEIASHLGARHSNFGFALGLGRGIGGRVAAYGTPMGRGDYRNSPYRDPSVCDIVDREQVRSGMALPVRSQTVHDGSAHVAAVLYTTRRTVAPFSLAEFLLGQRLTRLLEPLPPGERPTLIHWPGLTRTPDAKTAWYELLLHASRVEAVENWASQLIKGPVIVTDGSGKPYVLARSEELEQLRAERARQPEKVQVVPLALSGLERPGSVYLCPAVPLPPPQWPDFLYDLVVACNLVITRLEQVQDQLDRRREQWLRSLLKGQGLHYVEQDGYRLGLPVERGQFWVLAWPAESLQAMKSARKRMIAESVVLECLKSPLIFVDDDTAIVLLEGQAPQPPSKVRDALLQHCGVQPLWIVYGGRYHSLEDLKMGLTHTIALAQKARREGYGEYLLDVYTFGLDSLLENPRLTKDLEAFAAKLLKPLLDYDRATGSHLTETFVLAQTLGSAQAVAERLGVHVNTIRYRLHRAQDLLGNDEQTPKEQTAMALAAFIWQRTHAEEGASAAGH
ncbi:helix-turn-helix domain-containing protein [Thermogemmatispora sp.]|uniref:helix-turn-helix domain-containing protein n=1 Tax=Thermogemmatispora sp. TaxID=1968838 RepID=UPI0035E4602D